MVDIKTIRETLLSIARDFSKQGPGFAQEPVVLREAADKLGARRLEEQQQLLSAWHALFRDGQLSWGYDIDNPGQPFFHIPQHN